MHTSYIITCFLSLFWGDIVEAKDTTLIIRKVDSSSHYLHKTITTEKPLLYIQNTPHYNETSHRIFTSSYSLIHPRANAELHSVVNRCGGCLRPNTLVTPIRVSFIPPGTKLTVIDEFTYVSFGRYRTPIHVLLIKDEQGTISEIKNISFKMLLNPSYLHPQSITSTVKSFLNVMEQWRKKGSGFILYYPNKIEKPRPFEPFIKAFKLENELEWKQYHKHSTTVVLRPKTEEALVTLYFFMSEWGHHRGHFEYRDHDPTLSTVNPPYRDTTMSETTVPGEWKN